VLLLLSLPAAQAQQSAQPAASGSTGSGAAGTFSENPDVRVVVDVSGSMKANDPNRLAGSALDMLVALLPQGVNAGIWTFGESVDNPVPLASVDASWREQALALPPALEDYQQYTDIEASLRQAVAANADGWRHLVLVTDGVVDLSPSRGDKPAIDVASRERLLDAMVPDLANQGVAIHAIAFSEDADVALVESLAQQTGGLAAVVESPEALLGAFLDIVERIFPADQVPLDDGAFSIDDSVDGFSALVFHEPDQGEVTLIAPDGTRYSAETAPPEVSWRHEPRFDLIRVPDPVAGEWRVEGPVGSNSRITVSGTRRLDTGTLPTTLYTGFEVPLEAWITSEGDESSPAPALPERLSITATLDGDELTAPVTTTLSADGKRFRGRLPAPAVTGNARLVIDAQGEGFHRQRVQAVNILPSIGTALSDDGNRVLLAAEHPRLNQENTRLEADLLGQSVGVDATGRQRWEVVIPALDKEVRQPLEISAVATLDSVEQRFSLPTVWLNTDGSVGIDRAAAGPTLTGERFGEADAGDEVETDTGDALADRFVALVNEGPEKVIDWWQAGRPGLTEAAAAAKRDPRVWLAIGAMLMLLVVVVVVVWRRRRGAPEVREEPHV